MKLIRIDHVLLILSPPEAQCSEHSLTSGYAHLLLFFQNWIQKPTCLAHCLQRPAKSDAFLEPPLIWKRTKMGGSNSYHTFDKSRFWEMCVCVLVHTFWEVEKTKKYMFLIFVKHLDRRGCSLRLIKKKKKTVQIDLVLHQTSLLLTMLNCSGVGKNAKHWINSHLGTWNSLMMHGFVIGHKRI